MCSHTVCRCTAIHANTQTAPARKKKSPSDWKATARHPTRTICRWYIWMCRTLVRLHNNWVKIAVRCAQVAPSSKFLCFQSESRRHITHSWRCAYSFRTCTRIECEFDGRLMCAEEESYSLAFVRLDKISLGQIAFYVSFGMTAEKFISLGFFFLLAAKRTEECRQRREEFARAKKAQMWSCVRVCAQASQLTKMRNISRNTRTKRTSPNIRHCKYTINTIYILKHGSIFSDS